MIIRQLVFNISLFWHDLFIFLFLIKQILYICITKSTTKHMKKLFFLGFILMIGSAVNAQSPFKVISVNGEILAKKANQKLQNGLEVKSDDNFSFIVPNSRAALINPDLGRVILTEQNATNAFAKAAFAPAISTVKTRGSIDGLITTRLQLSTFFSENIYIIDRLEMRISNAVYPMNNSGYFFIRYNYKGEEINKRLAYAGDTLIIDKKELYTIDGNPIPNPEVNEMKLYYYEIVGDNAKAAFISSFNIVFVPAEQLKSEVEVIIGSLKGKPYDKILAEVSDYINSFYGTMEPSYIESWLNKEFPQLKK